MKSRRDFLKNVSIFTVSGVLAGSLNPLHVYAAVKDSAKFVKASKEIGLQLYSLGNNWFNDIPGMMKKLKGMGYTKVELFGYNKGLVFGTNMMEVKKMIEHSGLKITSAHISPPTKKYTKENQKEIYDFWKMATDDHAKMDIKYIIQPGMPESNSHEQVAFVCEVFNKVGQTIKTGGCSFGYHNHSLEFQQSLVRPENQGKSGDLGKGDRIYDLYLKNTDPELVCFELDVFHQVEGGGDPVEYMQKYPDRIKLLHIKDYQVMGQSGMMNFENIFNQVKKNGIKEWFVEIETLRNGMTQLEGAKNSIEYLKKSPFVN
ncbi:MAG TPA: sugar phosphate isomerase/epimerase [Ignavibacteria bacterium]